MTDQTDATLDADTDEEAHAAAAEQMLKEFETHRDLYCKLQKDAITAVMMQFHLMQQAIREAGAAPILGSSAADNLFTNICTSLMRTYTNENVGGTGRVDAVFHAALELFEGQQDGSIPRGTSGHIDENGTVSDVDIDAPATDLTESSRVAGSA